MNHDKLQKALETAAQKINEAFGMGYHRTQFYLYQRAVQITEQLPPWVENKDRIAMALAYHEFGFEMALSKTEAARWAHES